MTLVAKESFEQRHSCSRLKGVRRTVSDLLNDSKPRKRLTDALVGAALGRRRGRGHTGLLAFSVAEEE